MRTMELPTMLPDAVGSLRALRRPFGRGRRSVYKPRMERGFIPPQSASRDDRALFDPPETHT
jgi:hypothetical protein